MKKLPPKIKKAEVKKADTIQVLVRVRPFNKEETKKSKVIIR